jgi:DNA-binding CsgD family transcriptional regulator
MAAACLPCIGGQLSWGEVRTLCLVAQGFSDTQIARRLGLSPSTISHRVSALLARSGARSRTELVTRCIVAGALTPTWPPAPGQLTCPSEGCPAVDDGKL